MPFRPEIHRHAGYKPVEQKRKEYDQARSKEHSKRYDGAWRRLRNSFIAANPLCVLCLSEEKIVAAEVVDHVVTIEDAPERRLDPTNLRSLCKFHHDQRTAKDTWHKRT